MRMQPQAPSAVPVAHATPVPQDIAQGLVQAAFVDPNDPTKFYVSVPAAGGVPVATPVQR